MDEGVGSAPRLGRSARAGRSLHDQVGGGVGGGRELKRRGRTCDPLATGPQRRPARQRKAREPSARARGALSGRPQVPPASRRLLSHLAGHSQAGGAPRCALLGGGGVQLQEGQGRGGVGGEADRRPCREDPQISGSGCGTAPGLQAPPLCAQMAAKEARQAECAALLPIYLLGQDIDVHSGRPGRRVLGCRQAGLGQGWQAGHRLRSPGGRAGSRGRVSVAVC